MEITLKALLYWFDNTRKKQGDSEEIDWLRIIPFILLHISCLLVFFVGISTVAIVVALAFYWLRIFAIGAFYHRYFSHRSYKTNRFWQFIFALIGVSAVQRGPIWWAAHHRHHHQVTDTKADPHSPFAHSFMRSHISWFLSFKYFKYDKTKVKDLLQFPELCWLDRYDMLVPVAILVLMYLSGQFLHHYYPQLHTNGLQLVVWGFCLSTIAILHSTFAINSFGHIIGKQRYRTNDQSRNNWILALITFGEGWHNNHHHYPATAQQGFFWWELDLTYYGLLLLEKLKIIHDLHKLPKYIRDRNQL